MIIIVISVAVSFEGLFALGSGDNHARIWSFHKSMFVNKVYLYHGLIFYDSNHIPW